VIEEDEEQQVKVKLDLKPREYRRSNGQNDTISKQQKLP
jgi:hypothetical protein